jgi:phosphoacetylglucosamine mutase
MERATELLGKFGEPKKQLAYGTAGFRERHDLPLEYVFFRMGLLAVLRKCSLKGSCIGAVITASHNHEVDNGIKLVDWDGGMLSQQWEPFAVQLTNCPIADFRAQFETIVRECGIDVAPFAQTGVILIGRDTRPHSLGFHQCMEQGVRLLGATCADLGEVTTPILHFVVRDMNFTGSGSPSSSPFSANYWLDRYNQTMTNGYCALLRTAPTSTLPEARIIVDASFGVGSISLTNFLTYFNAQRTSGSAGTMPGLIIDIRNPARTGSVNEHCGAEHAQKLQLPPAGVSAETDADQLMCSFDGDGDRIVFHAFLASAGARRCELSARFCAYECENS